jgi:putative transposase
LAEWKRQYEAQPDGLAAAVELEYKAKMRGGQIVLADRFFPSGKTCSSCGHKRDELTLSVRVWDCPQCGTHHDRDVNAAIDLGNNAVSSTVSACGEEGAGRCRKTAAKPASAKQEADSKPASVQKCSDSSRFV